MTLNHTTVIWQVGAGVVMVGGIPMMAVGRAGLGLTPRLTADNHQGLVDVDVHVVAGLVQESRAPLVESPPPPVPVSMYQLMR